MTETLTLRAKMPINRQLIVDLPDNFVDDSPCEVTIRQCQDAISGKLQSERHAFKTLLPDLLKTNREQFVAIHDGRVIATGKSEIDVRIASYELFPDIPILVRRVTEELKSIERIRYRRELRRNEP